jgi:hypothetical protein
VLPALGGLDRAVAIVVPGVPFISSWRSSSFVLRIIGARNGDHLPFTNMCASLRGGDVGRATPNDHFSFGIGIHQDAVFAGPIGMNCGVRRVDLGVRSAAFQHGISDQPLSDLNRDPAASEIRNFRGGAAGHTQRVGIIDLDFRASAVARCHAIVYRDRRIDGCRDPVPVVAALG